MLRFFAGAAVALLLSSSMTFAQHQTDFWVGQNSQGQIETTGVLDVSTPVVLQPSALLGGWAYNDPGFDSVVSPVNGVSAAAAGSEIWLNVTSTSPGFEVISDTLTPMGAGDSGFLGLAGFHTHFTWHIHGDEHPEHDPLRAHWDCTFTISDASGSMSTSVEQRIVFQNVDAEIADVDQDGALTPADHISFLQVLADPGAATAAQRASADVDLDGYVTAADECPLLAALGLGGFVRGDTNADLTVDLGDAVALLGFLFGTVDAPTPFAAGDANGDTNVDVADAVFVLAYLFQSGAAPPAPFPDPGC